MNEALVIAFAVTVFLGTTHIVGWACAELGDRMTGRLAGSSRFRAALALLPIGVAGGLSLSVLSPQAIAGACHCVSHPHHLHLCLEHASFSWALVAAAVVGLFWLGRRARALATLARDYVSTASWAAALRTSETIELDGTLVDIVDGAGGHAWTVGVGRPRVVVCRSLWSRLDDEAKAAVVAHERAHLARRDPLTLVLVRAAACLMPAASGDRLLRGWRRTAEVACDRLAARWIGDAGVVASALVVCGRLQLEHSAPRAAMGVANDDLEMRVRTLLDGGVETDEASHGRSDLVHACWVALAGLVSVALVGGHSAHHALETLLSWVS